MTEFRLPRLCQRNNDSTTSCGLLGNFFPKTAQNRGAQRMRHSRERRGNTNLANQRARPVAWNQPWLRFASHGVKNTTSCTSCTIAVEPEARSQRPTMPCISTTLRSTT